MNDVSSSLNAIKSTDQSPPVSIVIPTWNGEKFLRETIRSVREQTYQQMEILIVDDGSKDSSLKIARTEAAKDDRIKVFYNQKRAGIAGNWNRGLEAANGVYVKIVCQDDIILPDCIQKSVSIMKEYSSVSLICSFDSVIQGSDRIRSADSFPGIGELDGLFAQQRVIESGNWIGGPTSVMFRRADLERTGMFDPNLPCSLDWEMWLRLLRCGNLYIIPDILMRIRIHPGQESSNCQKNHGFLKDRIRIHSKINAESSLYGEQLSVSPKIRKAAVHQLLKAAKRSGFSDFRQALKFLRQHQTRLQTMADLVELWFHFLRIRVNGKRKTYQQKSQQPKHTQSS